MTNRPDADIVKAVLAGEKQAFGELIERYWAMVMRLAYRYVQSDELAQDLAQESCLQAFLVLKELRNPASFRSWLYGITINVCRNYLRRQHQLVESSFSELWQDDKPNPEDMLMQYELRRQVQQALNQLSGNNRAAVVLFYYEGFSQREIADLLNISVTAVKGRLFKARQQLKDFLTEMVQSQEKTKGENQMIEVKIIDTPQQLKTNHHGDYYTLSQVLLFDEKSRRALVIWIDEDQAITIAQALTNYHLTARPMTHDLTVSLMQATEAKVQRIVLDRLENQVFYAKVQMMVNDQAQEVDARPSDAISLAVRLDVPIFVSSELWQKASPPIPEGKTPNGKGIEAIISRLDELYNARKTWIKQKKLEHQAEGKTPNQNMAEQARAIIDAAFS